MYGSNARNACPARTQTLPGNNELSFENVDEFGALVLVKRKSRAWLESKNLHLQSRGYRNILDEQSGCERRRLPFDVAATHAHKPCMVEFVHVITQGTQTLEFGGAHTQPQECRADGFQICASIST